MNLLSVQTEGLLWCLLIAIICTVVVHGFRLAVLGYKSLSTPPKEEENPQKPEPKPEKQPEPVYFLVERKKKKPKSEYSEPKQIDFR